MNDCIELMFALFSAKDDQKKTYVFKNMLNLFVRICVVCQDSFDNIHIQLFFFFFGGNVETISDQMFLASWKKNGQSSSIAPHDQKWCFVPISTRKKVLMVNYEEKTKQMVGTNEGSFCDL